MGYYVRSTFRPWSWRYYDPAKCILYNTGITFLELVKYDSQSSPFRWFFPGKHWLTKCPAPEKRTGISIRDVQCTVAGIWIYYPNSKHVSLVRSALVLPALFFKAKELLLPADFSYPVMLCICPYRWGRVSEPSLFFFHLSSFGRKSMKGVNHFSDQKLSGTARHAFYCRSSVYISTQVVPYT